MKKATVSIVTLHKACNYGAALQAYALKTFLCGENYDAHIYDAEYIRAKTKFNVRVAIANLIDAVVKAVFKKDYESKNKKFKCFSEKYFDIDKNTSSDIYVSGSDQVWNPIVFNPEFFLKFVDFPSVKASYAASIGVNSIPEDMYEKYREALDDFSGISVREEQAKTTLSKILGKDKNIRVDLDPVFLPGIEKWTEIGNASSINIGKKYILLYILHIPKNLKEICKWLKKETGAEIVLIDTGYLSFAVKHDIVLRNVGPEDFVNLIMNASAVVTTSFHGTAFSVLFKKEFYSIVNPSFPSRVTNLLSHTNLPSVSESQNTFLRHSCDFSVSERIIESNRETAREYFGYLKETAIRNGEH